MKAIPHIINVYLVNENNTTNITMIGNMALFDSLPWIIFLFLANNIPIINSGIQPILLCRI